MDDTPVQAMLSKESTLSVAEAGLRDNEAKFLDTSVNTDAEKGHKIAGFSSSWTVIVNEQEALLPTTSMTEHEMTFEPRGRRVPLREEHDELAT